MMVSADNEPIALTEIDAMRKRSLDRTAAKVVDGGGGGLKERLQVWIATLLGDVTDADGYALVDADIVEVGVVGIIDVGWLSP